jgi:hypothetical protein
MFVKGFIMKIFKRFILSLFIVLMLVSQSSAIQAVTIKSRPDSTDSVEVVDRKAFIISQQERIAIMQGNVTGHTKFELEGYNGNIGTADEEVWQVPTATQKLYVWPAAAATVKVKSSSANDTAAGTGARTAQITGLLDGYIEDTEIVTLNGITNVDSAKAWLRINEVKVLTAGTGGVNAGNITVKDNTDTDILSWIEIGENISFQIIYTVPAGQSLLVDEIIGTAAGNKNVHAHLFIREFGSLFYIRKHRTVSDSPFEMSHLLFPEKTDLHVITHSDIAGGIIDISVEGWLIDN